MQSAGHNVTHFSDITLLNKPPTVSRRWTANSDAAARLRRVMCNITTYMHYGKRNKHQSIRSSACCLLWALHIMCVYFIFTENNQVTKSQAKPTESTIFHCVVVSFGVRRLVPIFTILVIKYRTTYRISISSLRQSTASTQP